MQNPRHIVITGASSGLGAALADIYAAPGILLSLHGRDTARLTAVQAAVESKGATAVIGLGDVTDADDLAIWLQARGAAQPVDLLIANAGISAGTGSGGESAKQARNLIAVNVAGVINTVQALLPAMMARRRGQIALMASLAAFRGFPGAPAYCAGKGAVRLYGEALRGEMLSHGVKVNVICPGYIATPMTAVNPFRMPFIMSAERAAAIIKAGLARDRARIAFPWQTYAAVRLLAALPPGMTDWLLAKLPKKP